VPHYRLSIAASRDLDAIADYIMQDNPLRAISFVDEIVEKFDEIAERPLSFPQVEDLPESVRSALHGDYRIIFGVGEGQPDILRVVHGARDLPSLLRDLNP
jgi:plasmid stabilization system protein ParE